jgi:hypothetical protein
MQLDEHAVVSRRLAGCAGLLLGLVLGLPEHARAAGDVDVGGYHDEVLRAAHRDLLEDGRDRSAAGGIQITVDTGGSSSMTSSFTPRFAGFGTSSPGDDDVDYGSLLKRSLSQDGGEIARRGVRIGQDESAELAGLTIGWSAIAEVEVGEVTEAAGDSNFMLGGELALSGVRLDASFGQDPGWLGLDGQRMSAGVAYDFGPLDARVGYSLVEDGAAAAETSLFTLGSELALRPGLVVQGNLAYARGETRDPATAGLVSLRLSF